jgi:GNAT superfamily N-acetyltransferase
MAIPREAQVRYMAIYEHARGRGYGGRILDALETEPEDVVPAKSCLMQVITSWNSTKNAVTTYLAMPKHYSA